VAHQTPRRGPGRERELAELRDGPDSEQRIRHEQLIGSFQVAQRELGFARG
jgi:hypothetical protein